MQDVCDSGSDRSPAPDWEGNASFLSIHAGLSGIHRGLGELSSGAFGPLARGQRAEVERLEDTSQGILEELEWLFDTTRTRPNAEGPRRVHRARAAGLGLAALLYQISRDKKSGVLRAEESGCAEIFHFIAGDAGIARDVGDAVQTGPEIRAEVTGKIERLLASRTGTFEFTESEEAGEVQSLGLDTVRLILDGIRKHYSAGELRAAMDAAEAWRLCPGAMQTISRLPLSAAEMSIVRMLSAGWANELASEAGLQAQVFSLAAALHAFGLLEGGSSGDLSPVEATSPNPIRRLH